jgi:hypothetical protein
MVGFAISDAEKVITTGSKGAGRRRTMTTGGTTRSTLSDDMIAKIGKQKRQAKGAD